MRRGRGEDEGEPCARKDQHLGLLRRSVFEFEGEGECDMLCDHGPILDIRASPY